MFDGKLVAKTSGKMQERKISFFENRKESNKEFQMVEVKYGNPEERGVNDFRILRAWS